MNLKKAFVSLAAATVLLTSAATPVALAQDTRDSSVTVGDGGAFSYHFSGGSFSFEPATVATDQGYTISNHRGRNITVYETHSTSNGWTVTVSATELKVPNTTYSIGPENLSVSFRGFASQGCVYNNGNHGNLADGNPTQPFQTVTPIIGVETFADGSVDMLSAGPGRGCGTVISTWNYSLYVPNGTYTGGAEAGVVYEGDVTLTSSLDVGEPE